MLREWGLHSVRGSCRAWLLTFALLGCSPVPPLRGTDGGGATNDGGASACRFPVARTLSLPTDSVDATLSGESRNASTTCTTERGTGGPEHVYSLRLAARTGVDLSTSAAIDTVLAIRRVCDEPLTELACNDNWQGPPPDGGLGNPANARIRTILEPGDYYVLVDQLGFGVGGAYQLVLSTFETSACESASSVSCVCTDGSFGSRTCATNGTYADCTRNGFVCTGATAADGGGQTGALDFSVLFRPTGAPRAVDCGTAGVANLRFQFFDQALDNLLRTEVVRPCVPNERYRVNVDAGPYNIRVQGLNGQLASCYETNALYTVTRGVIENLNFEVQQHPLGASAGCVYPQVSSCSPGQSSCFAGQACTASIDCVPGLTCAAAPDGGTGKTCQAVFVCSSDTQCDASRNAACTSAGACLCVDGACQLRGCSADAQCDAGKTCIGGTCEPRPSSTGLTCSLLSASTVVRSGQSVAFAAEARDGSGAPVAGQSFTWASSNAAAAAVDSNGVVTGGSTSGTTNITCRVVGGASSDSTPVPVLNYVNGALGSVRVVVQDERTGNPLAGALVLLRQGGATLGNVLTTGADGAVAATATGSLDVHVFKNGYTYLSVIDTTSADLLIPLSPTSDPSRAGGYQGTFDLSAVANRTDTVEVGLAGLSVGRPFIELGSIKLLGEPVRRRLRIGNLYDNFIDLPLGLYLKLGDQSIKGDFAALGEAGQHHAWALGGKLPFDRVIQVLTPVLGGGSGASLSSGSVVVPLLAFFEKFRHFVKTAVNVVVTPRVVDSQDFDGDGSVTDLVPDFANTGAFPVLNAVVTQALTLSTAVTVPALPQYGGRFLEGAFIIAGANAPGRGLVPLGLSAALDAPRPGEAPDGLVDADGNTAGNQSTVRFKLAPLHSGLEGSKFVVATLARSLDFSGASPVPGPVSGLITQTDGLGATTDLGGQAFLGFPTDASFTLANRSFSLGTAVAGASFYRADFKGADGDWVVYFKAPASGAAFTLPAIPTGASERAVSTTGCIGGAASCTHLRVFTLATKASGGLAAPTLDALVSFGTVNLRRLNDFVGAFSSAQCQASGTCAAPTN